MFYYKTGLDLFKAQQVFIELATHLIEFQDKVTDQIKDLYYECLRYILLRSELGLEYVGFNKKYEFILKENNDVTNKEERKNWKQKMSLSVNYQFLLYRILRKVLVKLNQKAINE